MAPPPPNPLPAPPVPAGRRLAHALRAFWKLGFPPAGPGPPNPADPPDAPPREGGVTPFFWRHDLYAAAEAFVGEDGDDGLDLVVVVVDFGELATLPHAAATRATVAIATPMLRRRLVSEEVV